MRKLNGLYSVVSCVAIASVMAACGSKSVSGKTVSATEQGTKDLSGRAFPLKLEADGNVSISRDSLAKDFIMHTVFSEQHYIPYPQGLKSRLVRFELINNKVYLKESPQMVSADLSQHQDIVIAEYAIAKSDETTLTFDFNTGMNTLLFGTEISAPPFDMGEFRPEYMGVPTRSSYLKGVSQESDAKAFAVRQVAQVNMSVFGTSYNSTVAINYTFHKNEESSFKPYRVKNPDYEKQGFFATTPILKKGGATYSNALRVNTAKPFEWAVSPNTPPEVKQVVKEGIEYWNKVYGGELVKVVEAPENVRAPHSDFNVIQWTEDEMAGAAYADIQAHPLTGEILHAHVMMPSIFYVHSLAKARSLALKMETSRPQSKLGEKKAKEATVKLKGFQTSHFCDHTLEQDFASTVKKMIDNNLSNEQMQRLSLDFVRSVVAHEVGHTLGLMHNFAGSAAANFTPQNKSQIFTKYVLNNEIPGDLVVSSSVMDYLPFLDDAILGHQVKTGASIPSYDKAAINALYKNEQTAAADMPLYCHDMDVVVKGYADCRRFDSGNAARYPELGMEKNLNRLPLLVFLQYVNAKAPRDAEEARPVNSVTFNANQFTRGIFIDRAMMLGRFLGASRIKDIRRTFSKIDFSNVEEVKAKETAALSASLQRAGGLSNVMALVPRNFSEDATKEFGQLVDTYASGTAPSGVQFSFSESEIAYMKASAKKVFDSIADSLVNQDLSMFDYPMVTEPAFADYVEATGDELMYVDNPVVEQIIEASRVRLEEYVLNVSGTKKVTVQVPRVREGVTVMVEKTFNLPVFRYPQALRQKSTGLLATDKSKYPHWNPMMENLRLKTREQLNKIVNPVKTEIEKVFGSNVNSYPAELREWVRAQDEMYI